MSYELRFSDKEASAWGGLALLKRMLDHLGFDRALAGAGLPEPGSNRGYAPVQLIMQFMNSVWCGANRFEHTEVTRHDPVIKQLFGFARMANFKAVMRLFRRFTSMHNETVFDSLYRWQFDNLRLQNITLDLDSTVMTRYGQQGGAAKGYNPHKRGRLSHHPLMAFVAEADMVANCWLRAGNTASGSGAQGFLDNTLHRLGTMSVGLVRADSGFCDQAFLRIWSSRLCTTRWP
jgi:Transposase DDE domain group 1